MNYETTSALIMAVLLILMLFFEILATKSKWIIVSNDFKDKLFVRKYFYSRKKAAYYAYMHNFENYKIVEIC